MKKKYTIAIPIYKFPLSDLESRIFTTNLNRIKDKSNIQIVCPNSLIEIITKNFSPIKVLSFKDDYFNNIDGYNSLMISNQFYKTLKKISSQVFILQLDALILSDDFEKWANTNHHFIGAPISNNNNVVNLIINDIRKSVLLKTISLGKKIEPNPQNGGFSMRNTNRCYLITLLFSSVLIKWRINEDLIWSLISAHFWWAFKVSPRQDALKFCYEGKRDNFNKLEEKPMAIHGIKTQNSAEWEDFF